MNQIPNIEEAEKRFKEQFCKKRLTSLKDEIPMLYSVTQAQDIIDFIHQELQKAREETTEEIITDYMEALGTVQLPQEVWLWIADINGKYLNKPLKENI